MADRSRRSTGGPRESTTGRTFHSRFRLPERSGLSVALFLIAVGAYTVLIMTADYRVLDDGPAVPWWLIEASFATLLVLGIAMFVTEHRRGFRYYAFVHGLLSLFVVGIVPMPSGPAGLVLTVNVLAVCTYEQFPGNLVAALSIAALIVVIRLSQIDVPRHEAAFFLLFGVAGSVPLALVTRFRESVISLQKRVNTLEENVTGLTRANSLTQDLARDIEDETRDTERLRLTRDIHDMVGYTFTNAIMMTEAAKVMARREPDRIQEFMESIRSTIETGLLEVKNALRDLRNQAHPRQPIDVAVRKLIRVFSLSTGVRVDVEYRNTTWTAVEPYADTVYHFVQEGLINAFRHGRASRVTILLWDHGEELSIRVIDDGIGVAHPIVEGIGLAGMRERAGSVGGRLEPYTFGPGFTISMYLPTKE